MSCQLLVGGQQSVRSPFTIFAGNRAASWFSPACYSSRSLSSSGRRSLSLCSGYKGGSHGGGGLRIQRRFSIQGVSIDRTLQEPFHVSLCPEDQKVKRLEMQQMQTLNSKFAAFIDKVQSLEQKNQLLATKWKLLREQVKPPREDLEFLFELYVSSLSSWLEYLQLEKEKLETDKENSKELAEECKCRYEKTVCQYLEAEKKFAELKADMDCVSSTNAELEIKVNLLCQEIEFLRYIYEKEREQLENHAGDLDVVVKMDNCRSLDMDSVLAIIRKEYEEVVQKSKTEVDAFYKIKLEEAQSKRCGFEGNLKNHEQQILELTRQIERLQCEIQKVQKENEELQKAICGATEEADCTLKDAQHKFADLAEALRKGKDELACMLRDYQELLNVKIALDIEIETYRRLLEGEEERLSKDCTSSVSISETGVSSCSQSAARQGSRCEGSTQNTSACGSAMALPAFKYSKSRCQGERHYINYRRSHKTKTK